MGVRLVELLPFVIVIINVCNLFLTFNYWILQKKTITVNKHKEKRLARKQEQHKIADGMSFVSSANQRKELGSICKDLLIFRNNDLDVEIYIKRVTELEKSVLDWAIDLTERNMKKL